MPDDRLPPLKFLSGKVSADHGAPITTTSAAPKKPYPIRRAMSPIVTAILLLLYALVADNVMGPALSPLHYFHIDYPSFFDYMSVIAPVIGAIAWWALRKYFPLLAIVVAVLLCMVVINAVAAMTDARVERVSIKRFLTDSEFTNLEQNLPFPALQQPTSRGKEICIAKSPGHRDQLLTALRRFPDVLAEIPTTR